MKKKMRKKEEFFEEVKGFENENGMKVEEEKFEKLVKN